VVRISVCGADTPVRGFVQRTIYFEQAIAVSAIAPMGESNRRVEPRGNKALFPRSARLLRHADFERVYKLGRRHFSASMTVFYLQRPEAGSAVSRSAASGLRVGFTVGRALGGAVQRNRIKRRLREAVRLSRPTSGVDVDVVINPKKSSLAADFTAVMNEVGRAFVVIEQKSGNKSALGSSREEASPGSGENRKPTPEA
jgi:ribonuclease P protein component